MPDTVTPRSDADLVPAEPIGAEAVEVEPSRLERLEKLRTIFLGGLLALALLAASYAAAAIVLPILLAFVLNLVFRPVLRLLLRVRLPQPLAALIIVLSLVLPPPCCCPDRSAAGSAGFPRLCRESSSG